MIGKKVLVIVTVNLNVTIKIKTYFNKLITVNESSIIIYIRAATHSG